MAGERSGACCTYAHLMHWPQGADSEPDGRTALQVPAHAHSWQYLDAINTDSGPAWAVDQDRSKDKGWQDCDKINSELLR